MRNKVSINWKRKSIISIIKKLKLIIHKFLISIEENRQKILSDLAYYDNKVETFLNKIKKEFNYQKITNNNIFQGNY